VTALPLRFNFSVSARGVVSAICNPNILIGIILSIKFVLYNDVRYPP
jgi:hypothetical protein